VKSSASSTTASDVHIDFDIRIVIPFLL
jgi:hypothetical protein